MNMSARFDENPAMTLEDIKETQRYGRTDARTDNVKTVYPPQTKFAGGIIKAPQYYTDLGLQTPVNGKFKDFSRPLRVFQVLNFKAN